jgi:four helix bundle protein
MPTYQRFEELPVWQAAVKLYEELDEFLGSAEPHLRRGFADQLDRATLSISNNIAEGFERGTTMELLSFIYIARGSAGEARSMLTIASQRPRLQNFHPRLRRLIPQAESCSRQLRAWAAMLQKSDIQGPRHLKG